MTARPAKEREQAIAVIRDFLDKPTIEVKYACSDAFYSLYEDKLIPAKSETYTIGFDYFLVNPATNHIVEYGEQGGTWGYKKNGSRWFSERKQADYTKRYSQKELEEIATKFIQDNLSPLGITEFERYKLETQTKEAQVIFSVGCLTAALTLRIVSFSSWSIQLAAICFATIPISKEKAAESLLLRGKI